ncbi:unnamed protein product [Phytomonas sp. Hart1]|nr:unnamed protein product [Phytomonas sp. Hart1]|eukprot:CCW66926.1 unnamed protein product [Phytomonas sp. isolate Hart1]
MSLLDNLREEIHDVFKIFDDEEAGSISMRELTSAMYTITGERISRMEMLKLLSYAREIVSENHRRQELIFQKLQMTTPGLGSEQGANKSKEISDFNSNVKTDTENLNSLTVANKHLSTESGKIDHDGTQNQYLSSCSKRNINNDGVDIEVFEQVVMRKLNSHSQQEELLFAFGFLEDKSYPGYITKESLKRAAAESGEPLTDAEIAEMFDVSVTGVPTPAVDFNTFSVIQSSSRKIDI